MVIEKVKGKAFKTFCKREWLNNENSPSTGSVVVFDGMLKDEDSSDYRSTFLELSDCYGKVKLHKANYDDINDFIEKMKLLRSIISEFIDHLELSEQK